MKKLNIGLVGYGFMGRAHSNAYLSVSQFFDVKCRPVLKAVADAAPGDEDVERAYRTFMHSYWIDDLTARIVDAQSHGLASGLDPELAGEALGWMAGWYTWPRGMCSRPGNWRGCAASRRSPGRS